MESKSTTARLSSLLLPSRPCVPACHGMNGAQPSTAGASREAFAAQRMPGRRISATLLFIDLRALTRMGRYGFALMLGLQDQTTLGLCKIWACLASGYRTKCCQSTNSERISLTISHLTLAP